MTAVLELSQVTVVFNRRQQQPVVALDAVDLSIERGESVALVGRSGAGKSTVARVALGLVAPSAGEVAVDGVAITGQSRAVLRQVRRRIHMIFQNPYQALHPGMTVASLIAEPLSIARVARSEHGHRVAVALEEVGLSTSLLDRHPDSLSGGQRQRVAIARAVVSEPELVIADEPTSMLDASLRGVIVGLLARLQQLHGTSVLYITHDLGLARHVGSRIAVMDGGRIVEMDDGERVIRSPQHEVTRTLIAAVS